MKQLLLGAATLLTLVAPGSNVRAGPFDFTYTGSLVTFTVPTTDTYRILVFGAQGGNTAGFPVSGAGGRGAEIGGDFNLTAGEDLEIAVGGAGVPGSGTFAGGGGGGSFVVGPGNMPLAIAGGGGGGGYFFGFSGVIPPSGVPGLGGLTDANGGGDQGGTGGAGGSGGQPALGGGGGGGFLSAGKGPLAGGAFPDLTGGLGEGIGSFAGGNGGFGGGGGGFGGGGGGGGYSGGGGGGCVHETCGAGGGGGSFDTGTNPVRVADFQTGNGEVLITEIAAAIPEPGSIGLLGMSLGLLLATIRRRAEARSVGAP